MNSDPTWLIKDGFRDLEAPDLGHPIQQSIMPIITFVEDKIMPLGTGFIIQDGGLMMTARHVLEAGHRQKQRKTATDGSPYDHIELYALYVTSEPHPEMNGSQVGVS